MNKISISLDILLAALVWQQAKLVNERYPSYYTRHAEALLKFDVQDYNITFYALKDL